LLLEYIPPTFAAAKKIKAGLFLFKNLRTFD
jgi:hypothetical protein